MNMIGTGLKWLVAALGLVVWLGGVGLAGLAIWGSDIDVLNKAIGSVGLVVAFVLSVLLLRGTGELAKFLLCVFFGGIALLAAAPDQFLAGKVQGTEVAEGTLPLGVGAKPAPDASGIATETPKPAEQAPAAEPPAPTDGVTAQPAPEIVVLETKVSKAEETYIEASKKLARARSLSVKPDVVTGTSPPVIFKPSPGGPTRGIPAPAPPPPPASAPAPVEMPPAELKILEQEVAQAEVKYLDASKELASAKLEPVRMETRSAAITADTYPADLHFNKPDTMELGKSYVVEATIAAPGEKAPQGLGSVGPTVGREIAITRKVRVELVANDFKVDKLHTIDTVLVEPGAPGQWSWRVTPQTEGVDRKMLLQVWGVQEENGAVVGNKMIRVYEEKIPVTVTTVGRVTSIASKVISSWEMVAGIFGVLGGIWMFLGNIGKALRGKKDEAAPTAA